MPGGLGACCVVLLRPARFLLPLVFLCGWHSVGSEVVRVSERGRLHRVTSLDGTGVGGASASNWSGLE